MRCAGSNPEKRSVSGSDLETLPRTMGAHIDRATLYETALEYYSERVSRDR